MAYSLTESREAEIIAQIEGLASAEEAQGFTAALDERGELTAIVQVAVTRRLDRIAAREAGRSGGRR